MFLLDAQTEVYVWLGWWPQQKNKLLQEHNSTTGSAHSRWLRDKKLALQTALNYTEGLWLLSYCWGGTLTINMHAHAHAHTRHTACDRPKKPKAYLVHAGTEHERFTNQFPFWEVHEHVQEINCKVRERK